jgi:hypothetical protein
MILFLRISFAPGAAPAVGGGGPNSSRDIPPTIHP